MTLPSQRTTNTINTAAGAPARKLIVNPAHLLVLSTCRLCCTSCCTMLRLWLTHDQFMRTNVKEGHHRATPHEWRHRIFAGLVVAAPEAAKAYAKENSEGADGHELCQGLQVDQQCQQACAVHTTSACLCKSTPVKSTHASLCVPAVMPVNMVACKGVWNLRLTDASHLGSSRLRPRTT